MLGHVATAARLHGDYAEAYTYCIEALAIDRTVGFQLHVARFLNSLGYLALRQGDFAQASNHFAESLAIYRERDDRSGIANNLAGYGELLRVEGKIAGAVRLLAHASAVHSLISVVVFHGRVEYERSVAAARAQLNEASFDAAWHEELTLSLAEAIAVAEHDEQGDNIDTPQIQPLE